MYLVKTTVSSFCQPVLEGNSFQKELLTVLRIRIRRIHLLLGRPDPHADPLVRDTDPDPSIIKQK
jgi:hypothetical protein